MRLSHDLLLRWIFYKKNKELLFSYNGMPVCIRINKFALVIWTPMSLSSFDDNEKLALAKVKGNRLLNLVGSLLLLS